MAVFRLKDFQSCIYTVIDCLNIVDTFLHFMLCPLFKSIHNGKSDEANNKYECLYDGGDCKEIHNHTRLPCIEDQHFDPCPEYQLIGNGLCDEENFHFICSFDGGDCQIE